MKIDGSGIDKKNNLLKLQGFSISSILVVDSLVVSIAKTPSKEIEALIPCMNFLFF